MRVVRSTHRGPVEVRPVVDADDEEWEADYLGVPLEILDDEDALGDLDSCWEPPDEYEYLWDRIPDGLTELDDAPDWEREVRLPCSRCGQRDDLDPLGTCHRCRKEDGRCAWCGLDPWAYSSNEACRTCYQRLRRTSVTNEVELPVLMLEAAFRRSDLRKRRQS